MVVLDRTGAEQGRAPMVDKKPLEAAIKKRADDWPGFALRPAKRDENGWQLQVTLQLLGEREATPDDAGVVPAHRVHRIVGVNLLLRASRAPENMSGRYETTTLIERDVEESAGFAALALECTERAADAIGAAIALADAPEAKVVAAISAKDRGTREQAVVIAGQRRLKSAVPPLMEVVRGEDDDQDLVLRSIGALVAIGDERAVPALIDAGRRRSSVYLGQILFAVAQLGGKEAEAYLFTVANGHADPDVRANAKTALDELTARREAKAPAPKEGDKAPKGE